MTRMIGSAMAATGKVDIFRQLLLPIVNTVFATVKHVDVSFEPLTLTRIFDHYAGYRQLVGLEDHIAALRDRLLARGLNADAVGTHAAVVVLGRDSLLSSLSDSFIDMAICRSGQRLDDPSAPPPGLFGGVAIAERLVQTPFTFGAVRFGEGDRLRLYFQGYNYLDNETERLGMFGSGSHSCLGRALALEVWSVLAAELVKVPRTIASVDYAYDRSVVFTMPKFIRVELA